MRFAGDTFQLPVFTRNCGMLMTYHKIDSHFSFVQLASMSKRLNYRYHNR